MALSSSVSPSSASLFSFNLTRSFGVLLALLLFLVGFAMNNFRALSQANQLNIHTYQAINATLQLEITLLSTDASVRAFLVTGDENGLSTYHANLHDYEAQSSALHIALADNPSQIAKLDELDARQRKWVNGLLEPVIAGRRALPDASQQFQFAALSSASRRLSIKELRKSTGTMRVVEQSLLLTRVAAQERAKWWTQFTLLTGGAFSVLLTGFLVSFAARSVARLDSSNAQLREAKTRAEAINVQLLQSNAQLESEVEARRAADEKLRRSVLDLQRSNAELEQFAYVASHDLQEPLRAVSGCVQLLQRRYEGQIDARADQFIGHAVDGAARMQSLINDLLSFSRVGTKSPDFSPVSGDRIVASALQNVSVAIRESGAQITADPLPDLPCDAGQIAQVLQNLVSNAIKFRGAAAPRIHLGYQTQTQDGAKFHVLFVEDAGIGIEPQYFERIFVMFQRLHTRTEYAGTGIGLAICKKIIERHGGKIWVESWNKSWNESAPNPAPNDDAAANGRKHGSKFSFSLPVEPETGAETVVETGVENAAPAPQLADAALRAEGV